jgi:predicted nucleic acid-binding protein
MVLDASVLIALFHPGDAHHERIVGALRALREEFAASSITLAEVLVDAVRVGDVAEMRGNLRRLGVREVLLGPDAPLRLAELRVQTGLKLPDCCVLLAAQERGDALLTLDARLDAAAESLGL